MLGLVYTDNTVDKIITFANGIYSMDIPSNITDSEDILSFQNTLGFSFFRFSFFTSKNYDLFRIVNINVISDDNYDIYETPTDNINEKTIFISNDNLNIVAYRSSTYQIVSASSLLSSEIINIGELSFADMQTVVTTAAGLSSPQIKYLKPVGNDTVTFTELV